MGRNCFSWSLGLQFHTLDKANTISDCLENQFTPHDSCQENYERRVEARIKSPFEAIDDIPERISPYDLQKLINWNVELVEFQMNASGNFQEGHWCI
jgi:hypothetical protein